MSIASVIPFCHLILWGPLLLLPSIFPNIRNFSNESVVHRRWPKYWNVSFSICPSNEYSELTSFKIDCLISLLFKGLWGVFCSTTVQKHQSSGALLSQPHMTTGKTITWLYRPLLAEWRLCFSTHCHSFPAKRRSYSDFMDAVTICSDFWAQEEEIFLWKALKEMGVPDQLICFLRNLSAGQEATIRTLCRTTEWLRFERVWQGDNRAFHSLS